MPPYSFIIYSENWCMQGTTSLGESSGEIYEPRNNKTPVSIRRKNSCVSANMLKINWSVGRRNFFFFYFFFPEKTRVWPVIFIKTQVFC